MSKQEIQVELPLGRHLAILTKMYYGALTKKLEHLEIERHYSILILLDSSANSCTQKCIADKLKIDKASMVGIVDDLVKKKYVVRAVNPNDRREQWLQLTPKAIKIIPQIHQEIKELNKVALHGLTKTEATQFNTALCTISANLDKLPADRVFINYKKAKRK